LGDLASAREKLGTALMLADKYRVESDKSLWASYLSKVYLAEDKLAEAEQCLLGQSCADASADRTAPEAYSDLDDDTKPEYALLSIEKGYAKQAESAMREQYERLRKDVDRGNVANVDRKVNTLNALARALAAQNDNRKHDEAWDIINEAIAQSTSYQLGDCSLSLAMTLTSAQIAVRLRRFDRADTAIAHAIERADRAHLVPYQLEARLLQAESEYLSGRTDAASHRASELAGQAEGSGFLLVARKAHRLVDEIDSRR